MRWIPLLVLVACRHESEVSPDAFGPTPDAVAPMADAMADVMVDGSVVVPAVPCESTAPSGAVTVLGPPGGTVVFHDADGAVLTAGTFDSGGMASGQIPPCAAVTMKASSSTLMTVTHIMPGDTIDFGYPHAQGATRQLAVSFPAVTGAQIYSVKPAGHGFGCNGFGDSTSPVTLDISSDCIASDNTVSAVVTANDSNGNMLGYADLTGIPLASSGTTTANVTQWRTDTRTMTGSVANLPDPTWQPRVYFRSVLSDLYGGSTANFVTGMLPAIGTTVLVDARVQHPQGHESGMDWLMKVVPATATTSVSLDGNIDFAPHVSTIARYNTELARPVITWTTTATPTSSHAIAIIADWEGAQWYLVAPPNQPGAIRFPDLPAALRPTARQ